MIQWRAYCAVLCIALLGIGCLGKPYRTEVGDYLVVKPAMGESLASVAERTPGGLDALPLIRALNPSDLTLPGSPLLIPAIKNNDLGLRVDGYPVVPVLLYRWSGDHSPTVARIRQDLVELETTGHTLLTPDLFLSFLNMNGAVPEKSVLIAFVVEDAEGFRPLISFFSSSGTPGFLFIVPSALGSDESLTWGEVDQLSQFGLEIGVLFAHGDLPGDPKSSESLSTYVFRVKQAVEEPFALFKKQGTSVRFVFTPQSGNSVVTSVLQSLSVSGVFTLGADGNPFYQDHLSLRCIDVGARDPLTPLSGLFTTFAEADLSW